jgi:hypothetical protein
VRCNLCQHSSLLPTTDWATSNEGRSFERRLKCYRCGTTVVQSRNGAEQLKTQKTLDFDAAEATT